MVELYPEQAYKSAWKTDKYHPLVRIAILAAGVIGTWTVILEVVGII